MQDIFDEAVTLCESRGLVEVIEIALLDAGDIKSITPDKDNLILQFQAMREIAPTYKYG